MVHAPAGAGDRLPLPRRAGRALGERLLHQLHRHGRSVAARRDRGCGRLERRTPDRGPRPELPRAAPRMAAAYLEDLVVPEELPVSIDAYRRQQSRWATGSFQSAFHLLGAVLRSHNRPSLKLQAAMHLLAYGVGPADAAAARSAIPCCWPRLTLAASRSHRSWPTHPPSRSFRSVSRRGSASWSRRPGAGGRWWSGLAVAHVPAGRRGHVAQHADRPVSRDAARGRVRAHAEAPDRASGQEWRAPGLRARRRPSRPAGEARLGAGALAMVPVAPASCTRSCCRSTPPCSRLGFSWWPR